jgi:hypothetical protein
VHGTAASLTRNEPDLYRGRWWLFDLQNTNLEERASRGKGDEQADVPNTNAGRRRSIALSIFDVLALR